MIYISQVRTHSQEQIIKFKASQLWNDWLLAWNYNAKHCVQKKTPTFVFLHNSEKKEPIWIKISGKIANEMLLSTQLKTIR